MDIWNWVWDIQWELRDSGHEALADFMDRIPSDTVAGHHDRVDLYADEAIALARDVGNPWVEIFLRHWRLQSTVLHRQDAKRSIREAVELLEFSHRPENRDCPQSICAVQDLASCYGAFDGPGFADERISVCRENLERIDARWPCYECIGAEYAQALLDAERFSECQEFVESCDRAMVEAGEGKSTSDLLLVRIMLYVRTGEYERARKYAELADKGRYIEKRLRVAKAAIESADGKHREALEMLPDYAEIENQGVCHYLWCEVMCRAWNSGTGVSEDDIANVARIALDMEERGAYRQALQTNAWLVDIFRRDGRKEAAACLAAMKRVSEHLNKDLGASELIASLET
ncbi:MAG: hypothetical protein QNJ00_11010 [Woeseiaceae bacterium]|nr:hypothetical protein [Woeseiaceae bacterium]